MAVDRHSFKGHVLAGFKRTSSALHRTAYRLSNGRLGGRVNGAPVLLLSTTGRKSGKTRTVPLVYWERDGEYIVSASNAGHWPPAWYRNLEANQQATVDVGSRKMSVVAHLADMEESRKLWSITESLNPRFEQYRQSLPAEIPMVVLRPT
jgi:deazaflavin-dependent oxidoreductase (nitroreductase family)